jgi:deoxyinosine 3'endonuclease (endonuclease V)
MAKNTTPIVVSIVGCIALSAFSVAGAVVVAQDPQTLSVLEAATHGQLARFPYIPGLKVA